MKDSTWKALEADFEGFPGSHAEPVEREEIFKASEEIGVPFSEDYIQFVEKYGGANVGQYPVFGLREPELGADDGTVVDNTKEFRNQQWEGTENWAVIAVDHSGNPYGLDKDGRVWVSDHDCIDILKVGETFEEFLLEECLADDDEDDF